MSEYEKGLNGCEHAWRHVADRNSGKPGELATLKVEWCTACGCLALEEGKGKWHVMYPDSQDGSDV